MRPHNRWGGFKALRDRWLARLEGTLLKPVLLIDEAQEMHPSVLNELRLLTSADFDSRILLTVVLAGDGRLNHKLRRDELLPLGSRIRTRLPMDYVAADELFVYLKHLLASAGNASLMTAELMKTLCDHAIGNYRVLSGLAAELLVVAERRELAQLDEKLYLEVFGALPPGSAWKLRLAGRYPMHASTRTATMIHWWAQAGIVSADIAIRRADGAMLWQHGCSIDHLPLSWARAHNVRQADVYVRPARGAPWPLVFLDDVAPKKALRIAGKYASLVVRTSPAGGCHLWLQVATPLDEQRRYQAQRWLMSRVDADPGSVSGEHLGRLAGMKNWKRQGVWVNVIASDDLHRPPWDPTPALELTPPNRPRPITSPRSSATFGVDRSESGQEWGWVCGALEAGISPAIVYRKLVDRASQRRGPDAERYAKRTVNRALSHLR